MENHPTVSIILPVFNAEKTIRPAVESVLRQAYQKWELIIVNDGSCDRTSEILNEFQNHKQIQVVINEENRGLTYSLHRGFLLSQGRYVARMDADDVSHPERIQRQVAFMENHPDIALCGTYIHLLRKPLQRVRPPTAHEDIAAYLLFVNPIAHPTVMFRKDSWESEPYDTEFTHAQDYELWSRALSDTRNRIAIIPEKLVSYRIGKGALSKQERMNKEIEMIWSRALKRLEIEPTPQIIVLHREITLALDRSMRYGSFLWNLIRLVPSEASIEHFKSIIVSNSNKRYYPHAALERLYRLYTKSAFE